jgi:hypothetical protein
MQKTLIRFCDVRFSFARGVNNNCGPIGKNLFLVKINENFSKECAHKTRDLFETALRQNRWGSDQYLLAVETHHPDEMPLVSSSGALY